MSPRAAVLAAAAAVTAACGTLAAAERPAVIARPDARSRAELQSVLAAAFNGRPVTLADDALTHDSVLIVDRTERRDADGRRVNGRELDAPERFRLVLRDSSCELVRESDGRRWPLTSTSCAPSGDPLAR